MTILLLSRQEAAFNAAGEAMAELGFKISLSFDPDHPDEQRYCAGSTIKRPGRYAGEYDFGYGSTPAEAVRDLLPKYEAKLTEAAKLETAKEAITAVKSILDDARHAAEPLALDEIAGRIAALPVKE